MRYLLGLTRGLISFATTLHISGLRLTVARSALRVEAAIFRTDASKVAVAAVRVVLAEAQDAVKASRDAERTAVRDDGILYTAAQAEASSLRRGITL